MKTLVWTPRPPFVRFALALCLLAPAIAWSQSAGLATPAVTGQFAPLPQPVERKPAVIIAPLAPPLPTGAAASPTAQPAEPSAPVSVSVPGAAALPSATTASAPLLQGCRPLSDRALAVDLNAATAQSQKRPLAEQIALYSEAVALWTQAVVQCEGRPKERAQRNLADNLRVKEQLSEQLGSGPKCESAQRDAGALQDLARQALSDRRFAESAVLFRKAEDAWDDASELCTGTQQEVADKRREQSAVDGHNAAFCAPVFERARDQTQKLRGLPPSVSREDKQEQSLIAETLWRDATNQCKGAGVDIARTNAQALARERGTPWVARALTAAAPTPAQSTRRAPGTAAGGATAAVGPSSNASPGSALAGPGKAGAASDAGNSSALSSLSSGLSALGAKVVGLAGTPSDSPNALPLAPATAKPGQPEAQPPEFSAGATRFSGKFVRDADSNTFTGSGKITWPNGDVYDGTLVKGQRQGKGLFVWTNGQRFEGDWVQDTPSGKGKMQFANGNRYEGDVVSGIPQGMGRMQYASGDDYSGRLKAGVPEGRGTYTWKNGQTFDGEWKSERPNGQGILKFANGNVLEGTVVNGVPNGQGKLAFVTGELYTGAVVQGEPEGQGSFSWPNGDQYVGLWRAGKKHGQGVFTWKSGERWEGVYENDAQK